MQTIQTTQEEFDKIVNQSTVGFPPYMMPECYRVINQKILKDLIDKALHEGYRMGLEAAIHEQERSEI